MSSYCQSIIILLLFIRYIKTTVKIGEPYGILMCNKDCCDQRGCEFVTYSAELAACKLGGDSEQVRKPKKCSLDINGCHGDCDRGEICLRRHNGSYICVCRSRRSIFGIPTILRQPSPGLVADERTKSKEEKSNIELPVACKQMAQFKYMNWTFNPKTVTSGCSINNGILYVHNYRNHKSGQSHCGAFADGHFLQSQGPQIFTLKVIFPTAQTNKRFTVVKLLFCPSKHTNPPRDCGGFGLKKLQKRRKVICWIEGKTFGDVLASGITVMKQEWNLGIMFGPLGNKTTITLFDVDKARIYGKTHMKFNSPVIPQVLIDKSVKVVASFYKTSFDTFQQLKVSLTMRFCKMNNQTNRSVK